MVPGARKSKHSKEAGNRCQRFGARSISTRAPLPIVTIVCDDTATAPAYFTALSREVKQRVTLRIVRAPCRGASPDMVVEEAIRKTRELAESGDQDDNDRDAVWALLDLESEPERQCQARDARNRAEQNSVKVALSIPCYEVWTLLHLQDTGEYFKSGRDVLARVERQWQTCFGQQLGPKAQADYSKIVPRRSEAANRAEAHWRNNDPSRTEVFRIIRDIDDTCLG